jgi:hypothetical protein
MVIVNYARFIRRDSRSYGKLRICYDDVMAQCMEKKGVSKKWSCVAGKTKDR